MIADRPDTTAVEDADSVLPALSGLSIGALSLTPTFDPEIYSYTAKTANNTNTITVTSDDPDATITITLGNETETGVDVNVPNGTSATWATGDNILTITVTDVDGNTIDYVVTVVKS